MASESSKLLLSKNEAANTLNIGLSNLKDRIGKGEIPIVRIGRRVLLRYSDLSNYVASLSENHDAA